MDNLFKAQKKTSSVNVVINSIKELLLEKKLNPGDKLPNEMEIATGLGVSRGTVREALKILAAYGIIEIKVGNGTYISSEANKESIDPMLFSMLLLKSDNEELSEFRKLIECDIIRLVFSHKDKNTDVIEKMEKNLKEIEVLCQSPITDGIAEKTYKNDLEFHHLLGQASQNAMAEKVYKFILDIFSYSIKTSHKNDELGKFTLESHTKIFNGIKNDNLEEALDAVIYSIDVWKSLQSNKQEEL
jgi:DNA-binding FadR family transcriptional regulator